MTLWIIVRIVKFVALVALAAGVGVTAVRGRQADRVVALTAIVTPALGLTWLAGYLLMKLSGRSLTDPFVLIALAASLAGLHGAALSAVKPSPSFVSRWLAPAGMLVAAVVMVARDAPWWLSLGGVGVALVGAAAITAAFPAEQPLPDPAASARIRRWFLVIARLEGASLVLMLALMPVRAITGFSVDHGTGALAFGHGALFLLYLQALLTASRSLGWSWTVIAGGLLAPILPLGTWVFEWLGPVRDAEPAAG